MKFTTIVAVLVGLISKTDAVIINQTMAQVARQANLTKDGPIIREHIAVEMSSANLKNETKNVTIGHNESKLVGNTRNMSQNSGAVTFLP